MGSRLPLSPSSRRRVRRKLDEARRGVFADPEMEAVRPLLEVQARVVAHPRRRRAAHRAREDARGPPPLLLSVRGAAGARGAGRAACLPHLAARADHLHARRQRLRVRAAVARASRRSTRRSPAGCSRPNDLLDDIPASLNAAEMARRQFREIARVAGLVFPGLPRRRQDGEAAPGVERAVLRRVRALRPGEPAARARRTARCWSGSWSRAGSAATLERLARRG